MLRFWENDTLVEAPDGRIYEVDLVPAGRPAFSPRVFFVGFFWHLMCVFIGRAWRVEVREPGRKQSQKGWRSVPYIDVVGVTRSRRAAKAEAGQTIDLIKARGWVQGVTHEYP